MDKDKSAQFERGWVKVDWLHTYIGLTKVGTVYGCIWCFLDDMVCRFSYLYTATEMHTQPKYGVVRFSLFRYRSKIFDGN